MELLPLLRRLWRRRVLLGAGILVAVAALVAFGGTSPVTTRGALASTSVTVDTPRSQLVAAAPAGADTLAWRAVFLAHLMATDTSKMELARRLGVSLNQVAVVDPTLTQPLVPTDTAEAATKVASSASAPYVLTTFPPNTSVPLISIQAAGPDRADAARLAEAAVAVLQSRGSTDDRPFASQVMTNAGVLRRQPLVVSQAAPVRIKVVRISSLSAKAVVVPLFVFLAWCTTVLLLSSRVSGRLHADRRAHPAPTR